MAGLKEEQEITKKAREEVEKRTGKSPEQLLEEREKRFVDVIEMRVPDRMPVYFRGGYFAMKYVGLPPSVLFYDPAAYKKAVIKTILDFDPDLFHFSTGGTTSGDALTKLGPAEYAWPGGNLRPDAHPQFVEPKEPIMKGSDYDLFITDPSDFFLRRYLPGEWKALEPFSKLPTLRSLVGGMTVATQSANLSSPAIIKAFEAISKAAEDQRKFEQWRHRQIPNDLGVILFPPSGGFNAPFDFLTNDLRGMKGIAIDMFERPDKLFAAMECILKWDLARAVPADPNAKPAKRIVNGGGAHWGSAAFISRKQFDKFYWPTWKKALLALIDLGYIPVLHPEGNSDDRIECFLDLPKGKAFIFNEILDVYRAKEILGGHLSFMGGVPPSLLWNASPQEVDEYCKNLIKVVGKGGGYMLSCGGVEDDAKPENVKAMLDAVKKYGRY